MRIFILKTLILHSQGEFNPYAVQFMNGINFRNYFFLLSEI